MSLAQYLTANEIAKGLRVDRTTIQRRATREGWEGQKRLGRGGGYEYHISNLTLEERQALEAKIASDLLTRQGDEPHLLKPVTAALPNVPMTYKQRAAADARVTIVNAIATFKAHGISQSAALTTILTQAETGQLSEQSPTLDKALRMAKDTRGRGGHSPYPSARSLKRYLSKDLKELAPKKREKDMVPPPWANAFLACWQKPEKPSVEHAYRQFLDAWNSDEQPPSIHSVRRFLKKMGSVAKQAGRMGPRELKNIMPFVRRDFSSLLPGDIYSADGHTFDAEVQHPLHGRPFRPEVTTWIDIATRKAVGVSVALAESSIAVLDALIDSCGKAVPAVIYVDNGSGYCNAMLKDEATGVMARLGSTMMHSLPYNSQARGVIERVHQTLWVDGAKSLVGYMGADMDREALHQQFKLSRQAMKGGRQTLMPWASFMEWVHQRMDWYNERPHSTLPKITDASGKRRHLTPNEAWNQHTAQGWEPLTLSGDEAAQIFRPRVTRKVLRGEIQVFANRYFSHELTEWHGEEVQVAYDLNDPQYIWLFDQEHDRLICKAEWNANRTDYMPMSFIEQAREKRYEGRLKRIENKRQEIEEERRGRPLLEHDESISLGALGSINGELIQRQMSKPVLHEPELIPLSRFEQMTAAQRYSLHRSYATGEKPIPEADARWFKTYAKTAEYRSMKRREEESEEWGSAAAIR